MTRQSDHNKLLKRRKGIALEESLSKPAAYWLC
jgi:hypothetical protein